MSPIVAVPDEDSEPTASNVHLPKGRWRALDAVAAHETAKAASRGLKKKFSRTEIMDQFLRWAEEQYWADELKDHGMSKEEAQKFDKKWLPKK